MKRSTALFLCTFLDMFAIAGFYYIGYQPLNEVFTAMANRAEHFDFTTTFFIGFGAFAIPVIHTIGFIENYLPKYFNKAICSQIILGSFIIPLLFGVGLGQWVKKEIIKHGYLHCESADTHMKLFHNKVYVLKDDTCRELILEKKPISINPESASVPRGSSR